MGDADENILVIGDSVKRPQFTIRGLMLLVLAGAAVAWVMRQPEGQELLLMWPMVALVLLPLCGLGWSMRRVYRVTPERQALSVVCLIVSLMGLLFLLTMICVELFVPID
jgi:hypothetical protein